MNLDQTRGNTEDDIKEEEKFKKFQFHYEFKLINKLI